MMPSKPFNAVNRSAATRGIEASFSRAVILSDQREPKDPRWSFASNKEDAVILSDQRAGQRNGFHPG
jgi:hypothetical protein